MMLSSFLRFRRFRRFRHVRRFRRFRVCCLRDVVGSAIFVFLFVLWLLLLRLLGDAGSVSIDPWFSEWRRFGCGRSRFG